MEARPRFNVRLDCYWEWRTIGDWLDYHDTSRSRQAATRIGASWVDRSSCALSIRSFQESVTITLQLLHHIPALGRCVAPSLPKPIINLYVRLKEIVSTALISLESHKFNSIVL